MLALAGAYLECGEADEAQRYFERARELDEVSTGVTGIRGIGGLTYRPEDEQALFQYFAAMALIGVGDCSPKATALLRGAMDALAPNDFTFPDDVIYNPALALARARHLCEEPGKAFRYIGALRPEIPSARDGFQDPLQLYRTSDALIVGISRYDGTGWRSLPGVQRDVEAVQDELLAHGFDVEVLIDPTGVQLERETSTSFILGSFFLQQTTAAQSEILSAWRTSALTTLTS